MRELVKQGLVVVESPRCVPDTVARLNGGIERRGISISAQIDHSKAASLVGLEMRPTMLIIFGSPLMGTPLMLASPSVAIDLPLKVLVWEDPDSHVWVAYNSPVYLQTRHSLPDQLLRNIAGIERICIEAVSEP
jgi:uncharacterized protein (DUF302 family)